MSKQSPDQDDDAELFRAAIAGVKPLSSSHHAHEKPKPSTRPLQKEADERAVLAEMMADPEPDMLESGDTLIYQGPCLQDGVFRKLRRGQFRMQSELVLHGFNREAARLAVTRFLAYCQDQDYR